ncbi:hypothetical protein D3C80_1525710 [compost metagenome]
MQALCRRVVTLTDRFSDGLVAPSHDVVRAADTAVSTSQQTGGEDLVVTVVEHQIRMRAADLFHLEEIARRLLQRAHARQRHQGVDLIKR